MNLRSLIFGAVFLAISVVCVGADMSIRANDTHEIKRAQSNVDMYGGQIEISLSQIEELSRRNALSASATRAFQQKYAQHDKSFSGVQAFKGAFAQSKLRIVGPLVEPLRSAMDLQFFGLGHAIDSYGEALMFQENTKAHTGGGLIGKVQRIFVPAESRGV